jgi:hypothetical protein
MKRSKSEADGETLGPADLLTFEQLCMLQRGDLARWWREQSDYCSTCDFYGCGLFGRHLGPLILAAVGYPPEEIRLELRDLLKKRSAA